MAENLVITIGRTYGSGGRDIGRLAAEKLGIKCYDKELIEIAARENNIAPEILKKHDEKPTNSFISGMISDVFSSGYSRPGYVDMPLEQQVFLAQFETIKNLSSQESCVFVGRCADYALKDRPNVLRVFITADLKFCVDRAVNVYQIEARKPEDLIIKMNKKRASYYNYYTNEEWGMASNYDLCLNSSLLGIDSCVDIILECARRIQNS